MRLIRMRLLGLLSALVLALPVSAFAQPGYLCLITGQVSASCCCAAKRDSRPCTDEIKRAGCCQYVEAERTVASSTTPDSTRLIAPPAVVGLGLHVPTPAESWTFRPRIERAAHPPGPPRFLVHCAFLI